MPLLLADFIYTRVCKLKCEKFLTQPSSLKPTFPSASTCNSSTISTDRNGMGQAPDEAGPPVSLFTTY